MGSKRAGLMISILIAVTVRGSVVAAAERSEYILGAHFGAIRGIAPAQYLDFVESIIKIASEEYGYIWKIEKFASGEEVMEAFLEGKIDGAIMTPFDSMRMAERGAEFFPLATYTVEKRRKSSYCIWHRKDMVVSDISALTGATLTAPADEFHFIVLRELTANNVLDGPLWNVFGKFMPAANENAAYIAVAMGKADFTVGRDDDWIILKFINPGVAGKLVYSFCGNPEYARDTFLINLKTVDEKTAQEMRKGLKAALSNFDKHLKERPGLQALKQYLKMMNMRFIVADTDELAHDIDVRRDAEKTGRIMEAVYIAEVMKTAAPGRAEEIRFSPQKCIEICRKNKLHSDCNRKCMDME